jgi:hypothetical protein
MNKLVISALAVLLSACVSPQSRISDNPAAFASLSAEQQALVKQGQIAIGMPQAAVQLALGKPDRVSEHIDASGTQHIWHYTDSDYYGPVPAGYVYGYPFPHFYGDPGFYTPAFYSPYVQSEHDRIRVVFGTNGLVATIERDDGSM